MRRAITVLIAGLGVAVVLLPFTTWGLAVAGGWDPPALAFLLSTWPIIIEPTAHRRRSSLPGTTRQRAPPGCCWSRLAWPACWGGLRPSPRGAAERPAADAPDRRRCTDRRPVV